MKYIAVKETDVGISKKTNQDSLCVMQANTDFGQILMVIICDGMGGLSKGELASKEVVTAFTRWFNTELAYDLSNLSISEIGKKWERIVKQQNQKILEYGRRNILRIGTTFTGMLFINNQYLLVHVGDSRAYYMGDGIKRLTNDHTMVEREVRMGNMTEEEAKVDPRKSVLLQCVGAVDEVYPDIRFGNVNSGYYLLCSDGFRHKLSENEIFSAFSNLKYVNKDEMKKNLRYLIDLNMNRQEKDNISAIAIMAYL